MNRGICQTNLRNDEEALDASRRLWRTIQGNAQEIRSSSAFGNLSLSGKEGFSESLFYLLKAKETVPIGHPRLVFELRLPPSSMLALLLKLIDYRCLATKYCENRNPSIKYRWWYWRSWQLSRCLRCFDLCDWRQLKIYDACLHMIPSRVHSNVLMVSLLHFYDGYQCRSDLNAISTSKASHYTTFRCLLSLVLANFVDVTMFAPSTNSSA